MKINLLFTTAILAGCAFFFSCSNSGSSKSADSTVSQPVFDTAAAKKEIVAANQVFSQSIAKGDSLTAANCYTSDAKFMDANAPATTGRKSIQSTLSGYIKMGVASIDLTTLNVWGNAGMIAEEGTFAVGLKNGKQVDKGKYIVLWKKEDGKWKIFRDCSNSDLPATPAK